MYILLLTNLFLDFQTFNSTRTTNFVVFLTNVSLNIILQVYKCVTSHDDIFAVKIVKMEPQYTETQEVRLNMFSSKMLSRD